LQYKITPLFAKFSVTERTAGFNILKIEVGVALPPCISARKRHFEEQDSKRQHISSFFQKFVCKLPTDSFCVQIGQISHPIVSAGRRK